MRVEYKATFSVADTVAKAVEERSYRAAFAIAVRTHSTYGLSDGGVSTEVLCADGRHLDFRNGRWVQLHTDTTRPYKVVRVAPEDLPSPEDHVTMVTWVYGGDNEPDNIEKWAPEFLADLTKVG